jgi:hypothetical protein
MHNPLTRVVIRHSPHMNQNALLAALVGVCAVLLIVDLVFFSAIVTSGISAAARHEVTQHAAVPTPAALAHAKSAKPGAPAHA